MFMITVSTVLLVENGVICFEENGIIRFPTTFVKAGQETIQFAVIRNIKEVVGITLTKETLIPVDFRSDPDRSNEKNLIDFGFLCITDKLTSDCHKLNSNITWKEVNFEEKCMVNKSNFYMDHNVLLERALEVSCIIKE